MNLEIIMEAFEFTPVSMADFRLKLQIPDWNNRQRVHDWRNYIPQMLRDNWHLLSSEAQQIAYFMAECQANNEVWEKD